MVRKKPHAAPHDQVQDMAGESSFVQRVHSCSDSAPHRKSPPRGSVIHLARRFQGGLSPHNHSSIRHQWPHLSVCVDRWRLKCSVCTVQGKATGRRHRAVGVPFVVPPRALLIQRRRMPHMNWFIARVLIQRSLEAIEPLSSQTAGSAPAHCRAWLLAAKKRDSDGLNESLRRKQLAQARTGAAWRWRTTCCGHALTH